MRIFNLMTACKLDAFLDSKLQNNGLLQITFAVQSCNDFIIFILISAIVGSIDYLSIQPVQYTVILVSKSHGM